MAAVVRSKHEHNGPNHNVCSCIIVLIHASVVHVLTVTQGTIGMYFRWKGIFFEDTNRGKTQQNRVDTPQSRNISYGWLHSVTSKCTTRTISSSKQQCVVQTRKKTKLLQNVLRGSTTVTQYENRADNTNVFSLKQFKKPVLIVYRSS